MAKDNDTGLEDSQRLFADEYMLDFNGKQAAIRAGYSEKTAEQQASRLLSNVKVIEYLRKRKEKLFNKLEVTQESVLEAYRRLAFYDARNFFDDKGNPVHVPDLDDETAFALSGFEVNEERTSDGDGKKQRIEVSYTKKVKLSDRRAALDSICKFKGWNAAEKFDHSVNLKFGYGKEEPV